MKTLEIFQIASEDPVQTSSFAPANSQEGKRSRVPAVGARENVFLLVFSFIIIFGFHEIAYPRIEKEKTRSQFFQVPPDAMAAQRESSKAPPTALFPTFTVPRGAGASDSAANCFFARRVEREND